MYPSCPVFVTYEDTAIFFSSPVCLGAELKTAITKKVIDQTSKNITVIQASSTSRAAVTITRTGAYSINRPELKRPPNVDETAIFNRYGVCSP
jgi:hypothetical protein